MWSLFTLVYPCLSLFLVQTKKHHHHVAKTKTECHIYGFGICFYICQRWFSIRNWSFCQWPCNRIRFIAGTYHRKKAYFSGPCKGISPQNMAWKMVLTYLHFRILEFPLILGGLPTCQSMQCYHLATSNLPRMCRGGPPLVKSRRKIQLVAILVVRWSLLDFRRPI